MARAASQVENPFAWLRIEQFQHSGSQLPDKGMLVVVESGIPLRSIRHARLLPFRGPLPFPFPRIGLAQTLLSRGRGSRWTPEKFPSHPSSCRAIHELRAYALDECFDWGAIVQLAGKVPMQMPARPADLQFFYFPHSGRLPTVPQDGISKDQAEREVVHQRFQCAAAIGLRKIRVHPAPVASVAVAAVVALHAKSQRLAAEFLAVENNFAGEDGIRMRRAREADPAFIA